MSIRLKDGSRLKDSSWVHKAFLVTGSDLDSRDSANRAFSSASLKFTDTTFGGNFAINPPPQFTRFCDPKIRGRFASAGVQQANQGLGHYYNDAIEENGQIIHLRFGVPQFNSLTTFFTGFYNSGAGQLARTGRARNSVFYWLGRAAGFVVQIMNWKLLAVHMLGYALRFFMGKPSSKFYYLKPTMALYWNAVTTIFNQIAVYRGIVPRIGTENELDKKMGQNYEFDASALDRLHKMLPDVFRKGGGIDVYALANRAQRLAHKNVKMIQAAMEEATSPAALRNRLIQIQKGTGSNELTDEGASLHAALNRYLESGPGKPAGSSSTDNGEGGMFAGDSSIEEMPEDEAGKQGFFSKFGEYLKAELDDGAAFASFRVDYTGTVQESFSNSVAESELSNKVNQMSSSARNSNFNFANGNFLGGAVGAMVGEVVKTAKDFVGGLADSFQVSGLAALGGAAFVDIPKHWQQSVAQLPRSTYNIKLVSPYNDPISNMLNLYLPLSMLLAGTLPISTGKQSYTSPFLCEIYDKGRCQSRLAMIDSLSVTRGTGNLGWTNEGIALGIDVSFSVVDMSSVMHMPISAAFSMSDSPGALAAQGVNAVFGTGTLANAAAGAASSALGSGIFDDDTVFADYMSVLAGLGLADQIYPSRKLKLNLTKQAANFDSFWSISHFASFLGDTPPGRLVSALYIGTTRE